MKLEISKRRCRVELNELENTRYQASIESISFKTGRKMKEKVPRSYPSLYSAVHFHLENISSLWRDNVAIRRHVEKPTFCNFISSVDRNYRHICNNITVIENRLLVSFHQSSQSLYRI